jgi:methyl-accepting chemotaxis protein
MNEQNAGSQQILDVINTLNDISREVEASSDVMLEGSKQVIVESERLERLTHEMTTGITEMAAGADEINHAVQQLSGVSSENKAVIAAFMQEIARFKVD